MVSGVWRMFGRLIGIFLDQVGIQSKLNSCKHHLASWATKLTWYFTKIKMKKIYLELKCGPAESLFNDNMDMPPILLILHRLNRSLPYPSEIIRNPPKLAVSHLHSP